MDLTYKPIICIYLYIIYIIYKLYGSSTTNENIYI